MRVKNYKLLLLLLLLLVMLVIDDHNEDDDCDDYDINEGEFGIPKYCPHTTYLYSITIEIT